MITNSRENLDYVQEQAKLLNRGLNDSSNTHQPLSQIMSNYSSYFNIENRERRQQDSKELGLEIREWLLSQTESKLQDRIANHLIDFLENTLRPLYNKLDAAVEDYMGLDSKAKNAEEILIEENGSYCYGVKPIVEQWIFEIRKNVKIFAPDLYEKHSTILDRLLPIYDEYGDEIEFLTEPDTQSIKPGVKLKWNCKPAIAGYIISELIRAGYIEPPTTNGELSYAKLAGICNQIFEIRSDGKPTTLDYLKKVVNPESNQLPNHKRAKLKLPDLDQLT